MALMVAGMILPPAETRTVAGVADRVRWNGEPERDGFRRIEVSGQVHIDPVAERAARSPSLDPGPTMPAPAEPATDSPPVPPVPPGIPVGEPVAPAPPTSLGDSLEDAQPPAIASESSTNAPRDLAILAPCTNECVRFTSGDARTPREG